MTYDINIYFRTTFYKKKYYIYENTYFTHTDIHYNPSSLFVLKMFFLLLSPLSSLSKFNVLVLISSCFFKILGSNSIPNVSAPSFKVIKRIDSGSNIDSSSFGDNKLVDTDKFGQKNHLILDKMEDRCNTIMCLKNFAMLLVDPL